MAKEAGVQIARSPVLRPAGTDAALLGSHVGADGVDLRGRDRLRRFVDPRVPGDPGVGHALGARSGHRVPGSVHAAHDAEHQLLREGPGDRRDVQPRPALHREEGRAVPEADRHRRHLVLGPGGRVLHLRLDPLRPERSTRATTTSTPSRGSGTPDARTMPRPNLGYKPRYKEGYFPVPPIDKLQDLRTEMVLELEQGRHPDRGAAPRSRHRRPGRDRHALRHAGEDRRQRAEVQVHRQERRPTAAGRRRRSCRSRCSATTAPACTSHQSLWKNDKNLFCDENGYAGLSRHGPLVHRRLVHARARAAGVRERRRRTSYRRLVPGYEAPINLVYSQRNRSACIRIPTYSAGTRREAAGVPRTGSGVQSVPGLLRDADGRAGRRQEQDRAAGSRSTRTSTTCRPRRRRRSSTVPGSLERGARCAGDGPRVPAEGRRVHPGRDRHLDRVQAENEVEAMRCGRIRMSSPCTTTCRSLEPASPRTRTRARPGLAV